MPQQQINFSLTLNIASVLQPVTTSLPNAVEGQAYSFQLEVTGGVPPYTFVGAVVPPGLICSPTGLLSGIPTQPDNAAVVTIDVTDSGV